MGDNADKPAADDTWTEADSKLFIETGRIFTPDRERQHDIVCRLIEAARPAGLVVELCCGAGELASAVLSRIPDIRLLALDGSPAMIERARTICGEHRDRIAFRAFDLKAGDWRTFDERPAAVYSSLAIHHLDGAEKLRLFKDLFEALRPGGRFIVADLMLAASAAGMEVSADAWAAEVAARSQALVGDDRAVRSFDELHWNLFRYPDDEPAAGPDLSGLGYAVKAERGISDDPPCRGSIRPDLRGCLDIR